MYTWSCGRLLFFAALLLLLWTGGDGSIHHIAMAEAYDDPQADKRDHHPHADPAPAESANETDESKQELDNVRRGGLVLTKLFVLNRHGHRSPNAPYWELCPNDQKNRRRYPVQAEDLTGLGMQEEYELGQYLRRRYARIIGKRFNRSLHFFRAVGEPRILQSALAVSQGMFPDGYGPGGFLPSRPQFVPIFSDMDTHEYLLDDVPCFRRAEADTKHWINTSLEEFVADPNVVQVLKDVRKVCGEPKVKPHSLYAYIKTVTDGMVFNTDYGLKVGGGRLTPDLLFQVRNVSMQLLLAQLYHTDEQQTYTAVDIPRSFLRAMEHRHLPTKDNLNDFMDVRQESIFYFVHREALYAFAQFFGFVYNVPGLPRNELPVATALIIERLEPKKLHGNKSPVYIKFILKTPHEGSTTIGVPDCKIPQLCKLDELQSIYDRRVKRTGTWEKLCNYTVFELDHNTDTR